ncbi:MAG: YbhB/YbcL family Raf kinase inhibitor-like protein [Myxococcales bacterium]|nr:YbhB/YbcL family Raf kinase inhibitor-like protein [Myxococcales bacterium]
MRRLALCISSVWALACSDAGTEPTEPVATADTAPEPVPFELTSSAFAQGETIPLQFECGPPFNDAGPGKNRTPPLSWTPGPEGTASYVVVMRDRDFTPPGYDDGLIHWAIYDIPADALSLPAGVPEGEKVAEPAGALQAEMQNSDFFGYFGPCSPNSINTYRFTIYAMPEAALSLDGDRSEINVADVAKAGALERDSLAGES